MSTKVEREIQILKEKVHELSQENLALREVNVQFQLENFKLQQKIKRLEGSQFNETLIEAESFDASAEYLEEISVEAEVTEPPRKLRVKPASPRTKKEPYDIAFDEVTEDLQSTESEEADIKSDIQFTILEPISLPDPEHLEDLEDIKDSFEVSPKEAAASIFKLAAKRGIFDKIKFLEPGKQKDSYFVNKTLDLLFDRQTLAYSSARGQKCQAKRHLPVRPALDHRKMHLCRQAFIYRLKRERLTFPELEERSKNFNSYVNFKIQNSRRLLAKK